MSVGMMPAYSSKSSTLWGTKMQRAASKAKSDRSVLNWNQQNWRKYEIRHLPKYRNNSLIKKVLNQISCGNSVVDHKEIDVLSQKLTNFDARNDFLLFIGDCCEAFSDSSKEKTLAKVDFYKEVGSIIKRKSGRSPLVIGRLAGQYAKPRSSETEIVNGNHISTFKGEMINSPAVLPIQREPSPWRLLEAYRKSKQIAADIDREFGGESGESLFLSHEALNLYYEEAQVKFKGDSTIPYLTSTHFPWVGARTNRPQSAHIEFLSGIKNPAGIKVGPDSNICDVVTIIHKLRRLDSERPVVLFPRFGNRNILKSKELVSIVNDEFGKNVLWVIDPMHGNTFTSEEGVKTRSFEAILGEIEKFIGILYSLKIPLSGIHIESSFENVTECLGGPSAISERDLTKRYESLVDPRLNNLQTKYLVARIFAYKGVRK